MLIITCLWHGQTSVWKEECFINWRQWQNCTKNTPVIAKCVWYVVHLCVTDVYKGKYKGQAVAIKQLKDKDRGEQSFLQEASVMTWVGIMGLFFLSFFLSFFSSLIVVFVFVACLFFWSVDIIFSMSCCWSFASWVHVVLFNIIYVSMFCVCTHAYTAHACTLYVFVVHYTLWQSRWIGNIQHKSEPWF